MRLLTGILVILALVGCMGEVGLGQERSAGPFAVTLRATDTPPRAGPNELIVTVKENGQPVTDANVKLETSMPSMNMGGPTIDLAPQNGGYFGGLNMMQGEWQVIVVVDRGGKTGRATYVFDVK